MKNIICGLDIGTSKISVVIGEFKDANRLNILKRAKLPSEGLERGKVLDIEKFTENIEKIMSFIGADKELIPSRIVLGIGNEHLKVQHYRRTIIISERIQEVKNHHIERLIRETLETTIPFDHEVLHIFPKEFNVDGQAKIKDPRGMFGNRLSADFLIIYIPASILYNIKKGVYNAGYEIDEVYFSGFTSAFSLLSEEERTEGVIFLRIGGGTTTIVKFFLGVPVFLEIFPFGGWDIDYTIAKALGISSEEAKELKEKYGGLYPKASDEKIILENNSKEFFKDKLQEIIEEVLERFLIKIKKRVEKFNLLKDVPSGIVLGGNTFLLEGLVEKVEEIYHLPVRLGGVKNIVDYSGKEDNLYSFSDPIGLLYFNYINHSSEITSSKPPNPLKKFILYTKKIFEEYF